MFTHLNYTSRVFPLRWVCRICHACPVFRASNIHACLVSCVSYPSPQVDPSNMPVPVPSEDYAPPEDVLFEQVWDPSAMMPAAEGAPVPPDPDELVEEFAGAVSHDKVRHGQLRRALGSDRAGRVGGRGGERRG